LKHSPNLSASVSDGRAQALRHWLETRLGVPLERLEPITPDASQRRYFRLQYTDRSLIAMDSPPDREPLAPFLKVAALMVEAGLHVPEVLAADHEAGFALLSDLGRHTLLEVLSAGNADALFALGIDALVRWQRATRSGCLPEYSAELLRAELNLFPEHYLGWHLRLPASAIADSGLDPLFDALVARARGQAQVFVHRDFMPRNLMLSKPTPGVLDFQDAVLGPITYDPVCLLMDAFISWPFERVEAWLHDYHRQALVAGLPVPSDAAVFLSDCRWMAVQRHLKVLGVFARIRRRGGPDRYLDDAPRFFDYLDWALAAEPALSLLRERLAGWRRCPPYAA
jgi:N-acetylmuramate 1-kinase